MEVRECTSKYPQSDYQEKNLLIHWKIYGTPPRMLVVMIGKRRANTVTKGWDDQIDDVQHRKMLTGTMTRDGHSDHCRGKWHVGSKESDVWIDTSWLVTDVLLGSNGTVIEDACWLRQQTDMQQVNLTEMDTTIKGINLVIQLEMEIFYSTHWHCKLIIGSQIFWLAKQELDQRQQVRYW